MFTITPARAGHNFDWSSDPAPCAGSCGCSVLIAALLYTQIWEWRRRLVFCTATGQLLDDANVRRLLRAAWLGLV